MTALNRTPANMNWLQSDGFTVVIKKCPTVVFFTQKINIPGLELPSVQQTNPFTVIPHSGDHISFLPLELSFKVDENLTNYLEIYNWIQGQGYPDEHAQYKELASKPRYLNEGLYSDISILATNNIKNYNVEFVFRDAFPVSLTGFSFGTTDTSTVEAETTAVFNYLKYDINVLPKL